MEQTLERSHGVFGTKLIVGVFFILAGVLLTADNLHLLRAGEILRYWPAVIVFIGAIKLMEGRPLPGAILMIAGASLLANNAGWVRFRVFDLWPLLLIGGGASIVARALGFRTSTATVSGDNIWAILSTRKVAPAAITRANAGAFMGSVELDLTQAQGEEPVLIDVFAWWGGIVIYVPDDWDVTGEVVPFMAGFDVNAGGGARRRLTVRGAAIMSGIEIKRRMS